MEEPVSVEANQRSASSSDDASGGRVARIDRPGGAELLQAGSLGSDRLRGTGFNKLAESKVSKDSPGLGQASSGLRSPSAPGNTILILTFSLRLSSADSSRYKEGYAFTSLILDKIKKKFKVQDICFKKKSQNHQAIEDWKDDSDDDDTDFFLSNDRCKEKDHSVEDDRIIPDDCEDLKACSNLSESAQELLKSGSVGLTSDNPGFEYSTKLIFIRNFIKEKLLGGDMYKKIVIFAQFTTMLDLIEAMLIQEGIKSLRFDGRIQKPEIRSKIIQMFDDEPEYRIILTSLKAGGVGLNLVAANCLFLVDPWWNRSVELQAFDRVHRIGQKHPVHVFRLLIRVFYLSLSDCIFLAEDDLGIHRRRSSQDPGEEE